VPTRESASDDRARLTARPGAPTAPPGALGRRPLGIATTRDAILYVPSGYAPEHPAPLLVMLHGAGGGGGGTIGYVEGLAEARGVLVLAPDSRGPTWDVIMGHYGPDVAYLDRALGVVFAQYAIDPARVAVGGFSDGASYALSIGISNGDLFRQILAFSPGFVAPAGQRGEPRIYVSHGTRDEVLPIDRCSRRIVPMLRRAGYDVEYREFDGPHTVPEDIAREALDRLA
jgi:phospholipase/carboxylesterase